MFNSSLIGQSLEDDPDLLKGRVLLGDSGYPVKTYLLVPFDAPHGRPQERYNRAHKSTRTTVERTIGRWKKRFRVLHNEMRLTPEKACRAIMACAVLHNIAIAYNEPDVDEEDVIEEDGEADVHGQGGGGAAGRAMRDAFVQRYFSI